MRYWDWRQTAERKVSTICIFHGSILQYHLTKTAKSTVRSSILLQFKTRITHEYIRLKSYYVTNHFRFIFVLVLGAMPNYWYWKVVTAKTSTAFLTVWIIDKHAGHWWWSKLSDLNVAWYYITVFLWILFETTDFCFSLFNNPEIEALKPGDQRSKPGESGSTVKPGGLATLVSSLNWAIVQWSRRQRTSGQSTGKISN